MLLLLLLLLCEDEEERRSVDFSWERVCVPSVKMSFGMGRSPCSKGSRRGWRWTAEIGCDAGGGGSGESVIALDRRTRKEMGINKFDSNKKSIIESVLYSKKFS